MVAAIARMVARADVTAYDAMYVALAEALPPIVACDTPLAKHRATARESKRLSEVFNR